MKKWLVMALSFLLLAGCAGMRTDIISLTKEDMKNAQTARQSAKNLLSTWMLNSGFIRGSLGNKIYEFPGSFLDAMDQLDAIAETEDRDDFALGYSLGIRVRLLGQLVENALASYAPEVLKYLPLQF
jgi:hypothetical protein